MQSKSFSLANPKSTLLNIRDPSSCTAREPGGDCTTVEHSLQTQKEMEFQSSTPGTLTVHPRVFTTCANQRQPVESTRFQLVVPNLPCSSIINTLSILLALKIPVSAVRFCPWPPEKISKRVPTLPYFKKGAPAIHPNASWRDLRKPCRGTST
jgi:hypothetical protein